MNPKLTDAPADAGVRSLEDSRPFHEQFVIIGKLGFGAFSSVYMVKSVQSEGSMAAKVTELREYDKNMKAHVISLKRMRMAVTEAFLLRKVRKSLHVVNIIDSFIEEPFSYLIMEKCDMTLLEALERAPDVTEDTINHITQQMLMALQAIHGCNIIHRDVKPDNFMCTGECCTVKLCDFGLAAEMVSEGLRGVYGTPPFMSPEMLELLAYGPKTDVWSLGVLTYTLMYGQFPYVPLIKSSKGMKAAIVAGLPPPNYRPSGDIDTGAISESAEQAIRTLLHRDPACRPTAHAAKKLAWFNPKADGPNRRNSQSLKIMLHSAKRQGVFETRAVVGASKPDSMSTELAMLQTRFHGKSNLGEPRSNAPTTSCSPTPVLESGPCQSGGEASTYSGSSRTTTPQSNKPITPVRPSAGLEQVAMVQ